MIAGALFLLGALGLALVTVLFIFEYRSGRRFASAFRSRCDYGVRRAYRVLVFGEIPHTYREAGIRFARSVLHSFVYVLVTWLRSLERTLVRMNHRLTHTARVSKSSGRTPSPFLREIGDHPNGDGKKNENQV
jgi:hypothetical protein